jgi:peptide/nickel transport system permease protein
MLMVLAYMFRGGEIDAWLNELTGDRFRWLIGGTLDETLIPVFVAFSATFWIGPCRVIRGETLKLRESEYVQAAQVMGYSRVRILLRHILPNISHLMLINFSLLFIGAIKSEVILSFLGIGVQSGASWGLMIDAARDEVLNDFFWQIGAATALMFGLVLAFNILSDALQDILDPKHV